MLSKDKEANPLPLSPGTGPRPEAHRHFQLRATSPVQPRGCAGIHSARKGSPCLAQARTSPG